MVNWNKKYITKTKVRKGLDFDDVLSQMFNRIDSIEKKSTEKPYVIVEDEEMLSRCNKAEEENALLIKEIKRLKKHEMLSRGRLEALKSRISKEAKKDYEKDFSNQKLEVKRLKNRLMNLKKECCQKDKRIEVVEKGRDIQSWLLLFVLLGVVIYSYSQIWS